ncbi:hypothetical protein H6F77_10030 [Microcoleus sp. FACHB-831]|uniref:hypothetical protein n=1 Tax=Microcoleus sp. FACHB-831 TaxID=2692827 RepID=UPI0016874FC6|nr:hypothetical protein [Microcoleus sp. FACHB-831]MBD1921427.1 hypothetical protein [Microcoleus sp. FACHB-831]
MSEHRLNEIVIERPRRGMRISSKKVGGYKKALQKLTEEAIVDGLLSPYLIKPRHTTKHFSDHLGPLYRWLRSKVGQRWDDAYSELCRSLDSSTITGRHVLSHVWHFVELNVVLIDGVPYRKDRQEYPLDRFCWTWKNQLYVNPETGILSIAEKAPKELPKKREDLVVIDKYHHYRKVDDVLFRIVLQDLPPMSKATDIVLKATINASIAWQEYGSEVYAVSKQQCSKKEIKFIMKQLAKN